MPENLVRVKIRDRLRSGTKEFILMDMTNPALVEEGRDIFLSAMRSGYAANVPAEPFPGIPGSKHTTYTKGPWTVLDIWVKGESGHSAGSTLISFEGRPFWQMQYQGWYPKEFTPFLKRALAENYKNNVFLCGRGPESLTMIDPENPKRTFWYRNTPDQSVFHQPRFAHFSGREQMGIAETLSDVTLRIDKDKLFAPKPYHEYQGMLLSPHTHTY